MIILRSITTRACHYTYVSCGCLNLVSLVPSVEHSLLSREASQEALDKVNILAICTVCAKKSWQRNHGTDDIHDYILYVENVSPSSPEVHCTCAYVHVQHVNFMKFMAFMKFRKFMIFKKLLWSCVLLWSTCRQLFGCREYQMMQLQSSVYSSHFAVKPRNLKELLTGIKGFWVTCNCEKCA